MNKLKFYYKRMFFLCYFLFFVYKSGKLVKHFKILSVYLKNKFNRINKALYRFLDKCFPLFKKNDLIIVRGKGKKKRFYFF